MTKERWLKVAQRWRWVVYPAAVLLVALGFDFQTPGARFLKVEARQDSLAIEHQEIKRYLRALAVVQCIDRPQRDWQLMGLPCAELLQRGVIR